MHSHQHKKNIVNALITSVDVSRAAISIAEKNAANNNVKIDFLQMDFLDEGNYKGFAEFDLIISNPPYIPENDKNMFVGSKKINMDSLESVLRKYINEGDSIKPAVVINADSVSQWGEIVKVMRIARKLGATTSATVTGSDK